MSLPLLITFCKELRVLHRAFYQKRESFSPSSVTATVLYQSACWEVSGVRRSWRQTIGFALSVGLNESNVAQSSPKYSENTTAAFTEQILIQCWEKG